MLISPTEPRSLRELGTVSSQPERYGVDFLLSTPLGLVGIQRKEIIDLVASAHDGRLSRELAQMKKLDIGILLIEGRPTWTDDGLLMSDSSWTIAQHLGMKWSLQLQGYWIADSTSLSGSRSLISLFTKWVTKSSHKGFVSRPKPKGEWGRADSRDWGIHLLQSFSGVGPEVAARIYDTFGGVPLAWTVGIEDLIAINGVGEKRAEAMSKALGMADDIQEFVEL